MTILEDLKAGRLVVVPGASDIAMDKAGIAAIANAMGATGGLPGWAASDCYKAMLAASPDHTTALLSLVEGMETQVRESAMQSLADGYQAEEAYAAQKAAEARARMAEGAGDGFRCRESRRHPQGLD